ncbi:MAG: YIP1 family protein [Defluviitaleaceae bacterium]|nr:YIP1 family protein [Defluviitaleaceae bacterium]
MGESKVFVKSRAFRAAFAAVFAAAMVLILAAPAFAASFVPYYTYQYNAMLESNPTPVGYVPGRAFSAGSIGLDEDFVSLQHIYYDGKGLVYILDGGSAGKIVITDVDFNLVRVFEGFTAADGSQLKFTGAQGFAVDGEGRIFVADTESRRILVASPEGEIVKIIGRPDESLNNTNAPFDVTKIIVDKDGVIYAIAKSINIGVFRFAPDGEFMSFWGPNEVPSTGRALINYIRKRLPFMTNTQIAFLRGVTPVTVRNFAIDSEGFIFTISPYKDLFEIKGNVRKLNFKGEDILADDLQFGDYEIGLFKPEFADLVIDGDGFINLLDYELGKVYQHNEDGFLVTVFGTKGDQKGSFNTPTSITEINGSFYVTDMVKNMIFEFNPTEYVLLFREAMMKMTAYELEESKSLCVQILTRNSNSDFVRISFGRIADAQGDYKAALGYFATAMSLTDYSLSYKIYRQEFLADNWLTVVIVAFAAVAALMLLGKLWSKYSVVPEGRSFSKMEESKYLFPLHVLTHPTDGFSQFKSRKNESIIWVLSIVAAWFAAEVMVFFFTGTALNENRPEYFNAAVIATRTIGLFVFFIIGNWSVCSLLDGKGTFLEITTTTAYSLIPYVASIFINVLISRFIAADESVYMTMSTTIGLAWSVILLLSGLYSIHDYGFLKTIFSAILTVIAMAIMLFLLMLFLGLLQQVFSFCVSVYMEGFTRWG